MQKTEDEYTIDLLKLAKEICTLKNIVIMLLVGVLTGGITFTYSKFVLPELYQSSVSLYVNNETSHISDNEVDMSGLTTARSLANSYVIILKNDVVMEEIGNELLRLYSVEDISKYFIVDEKYKKPYIKGKYIGKCFDIAPVEETEILKVTVTTENPQLSADMCNAMVKFAPKILRRVVGAGSVEAIGIAVAPDEKCSPNNRGNAMKGFAIGVAIVIGVLVIRFLLDSKIKGTESFKERFDYPVFAEIPAVTEDSNKNNNKNNNSNLISADSFQVTEAFNSLCNNLMVTMSMNDEKIIVISSPEMSDGKSTVSLHLAKTMAKMGNRVLLMDLDLRRPSIHKKLNMSNKSGIKVLLSKNANIDQCIHKNVFEKMDIILSGGISPNPAEMFSSKRMESLINQLKDNYDYIVIDSPPVNVVNDACIISKLAAGIVVVLRSNLTHFDDFKHSVENIEIAHGKILGVIINGVEEAVVKKYRYGGRYGYKYGYKYGYTDDKE